LFALPGVPAEMKELWEQSVRPALLALRAEPRVISHRVIKCFGVGESELEQMLPDLIRRGRVPSVGITASRATIALRITAEGADEEACQRLMEPTLNTIRSCLGTLIFGEGEGELQHAVAGLLSAQQQTLALADCGTEALVVHWLSAASTAAPGCFRGALAMSSAVDWLQLGAPTTLAERQELVPLVSWLAEDCRRRFAAQLGLAIGPWPGEPGADIIFALATPAGTLWRAASTAGHPELQRARAAKQALNLVRLWLSGAPTDCSGRSACGT
jgi:nicotinamide-nucleotide amidase